MAASSTESPQPRDGTQDPGTGKIFSQFLRQFLCRGESAIGNDEPLAIFTSTLQGSCPCCAAGPGLSPSNREDRPQIPAERRERILCHRYCSREALRYQYLTVLMTRNGDAIHVVINFVHQFGGSDFVRRS